MPSPSPSRASRGNQTRTSSPASTVVSAPKKVSPSRIVVKGNRGVKVTRSVTIRRPAGVLFAFWRDVENLPRIIKHPVTITRVSDLASHWEVSAPGDRKVEWDAVIINEHPNELIAWRSREDAEIPHAGTVRFHPAPGDEGTEVTVNLEYDPPAGKLGSLLAKLTGEEPAQQVSEALRRFKALMETGEIPTTEGQAVGKPQSKEPKK
jgi:uncharacterized membrane protein